MRPAGPGTDRDPPLRPRGIAVWSAPCLLEGFHAGAIRAVRRRARDDGPAGPAET
jgi:hypothetical protein